MNTNETNRITGLLDENDPRLTAYVLGELSTEDVAIVETALQADAALRTEVETIRATVAALSHEFHVEAGGPLAPKVEKGGPLAPRAAGLRPWEQSDEVTLNGTEALGTGPLKLVRAEGDGPVIHTHPTWSRRLIAGLGLAAAACFVLTATLPMWSGDGQRGRLVGRSDEAGPMNERDRLLDRANAPAGALSELPGQSIDGWSGQHVGTTSSETPTSLGILLNVPGNENVPGVVEVPHVAAPPTMMSDALKKEMSDLAGSIIIDLKQSDPAAAGDQLSAHLAERGSVLEPSVDGSTGTRTVVAADGAETASRFGVAPATGAPPPPPPPAPKPAGSVPPVDLPDSGLSGGRQGQPAGISRSYGTETIEFPWQRAQSEDARFVDGRDVPFVTSTNGAPSVEAAKTELRRLMEGHANDDSTREQIQALERYIRSHEFPGSQDIPEPVTAGQIASMSVDEAKLHLGKVAKARRFAQADDQLDRRLREEFNCLMERIRQDGPGTENYNYIDENDFFAPADAPLSTFAIDVDTASYANMRRFLRDGQLPPRDAIRIEELINYFPYEYTPPTSDSEHPFSANVEVGPAPWQPKHKLVRIGLKGKEADLKVRPPTNLVFLLDVSGSMNSPDKLPLVQASVKALVNELNGDDRIALVVYAGAAGLVLPSTFAHDKNAIMNAIDALSAGGSTAGGAGIQLAYDTAAQHFIKDGVNRVILCTDGDFNVGISSESELIRLIEEKRKTNIFLSVLGFGTGNLQDAKMEQLANHGNGHYAYIDSLMEGRKVLVEEMGGTLITIAKDVKIQVEFNPAKVAAYRQIGYENRALAARDFNDDTKDAGEIGAGHAVTALYEIVPVGVDLNLAGIDPLKYQKPTPTPQADPAAPEGAKAAPGMAIVPSDELLTVKLRYKKPEGSESQLFEVPVVEPQRQTITSIIEGRHLTFEIEPPPPSADFQFASAVAAFGMVLRDSQYKGNATFANIQDWAGAAIGEDPAGYRAEFVQLVERARRVTGQ